MHLERALEQANSAILTDPSSKRPEKNEWPEFCALVQKLEIDARQRGQNGLVISLALSFQRLHGFRGLFQALLLSTDRWAFEYEDALQLVANAEDIIRRIEDKSIQKEERDKTRDILARIRGLDRVKQLAVPKPNRVFLEERMLNPIASDAGITQAVGIKRSLKLSSDLLLRGMGIGGSRKNEWLVVFNDVALRCQCIGITSPPLGGAAPSRANFLSELEENPRYVTTTVSRRNTSARPRNLYKFIKASAAPY